jgi:nickel-dependent lactate racemase
MEPAYNFPRSWHITTLESKPSQPVPDLQSAAAATLISPLHSPPLRQLVSRSRRVCIAFTDATRACPDQILVPSLLRELAAAGVPDDHITLLCATGMHRPSTFEEKIAKLGAEVALRYEVIDHQAQDLAELADLGGMGRPQLDLPIDVPVFASRLAAVADLLIATGVVEPHQYAGYSGGGKTVTVGCGGEATIAALHGPAFLDDPRVRLGQVESNPFQAAVREGAGRAGLKFVSNVVLDQDRRVVAIQSGEPTAVHDQLVETARQLYEVPIPRQYDVVVAGIGSPKDVNVYQASRAPTYIGLASTPVVRDGGVIITPARCWEGAGQGPGERRFFEALSTADDLNVLLDDMRQRGIRAGEQRAFMVAQVLIKNTVIIAGSECPDDVRACKMIPAATMDEAIAIARGVVGGSASALIVPHALQTLPIVSEQ